MVPFKALVNEKVEYFTRLLQGTGLHVAAYYSGHGEVPLPKLLSVAVCTSEKAAAVVDSMASHGRLHEIVAVVIDEFHSVGADARGVCLEGTVAKLLLHTRRAAVAVSSGCSSQGSAGTTAMMSQTMSQTMEGA